MRSGRHAREERRGNIQAQSQGHKKSWVGGEGSHTHYKSIKVAKINKNMVEINKNHDRRSCEEESRITGGGRVSKTTKYCVILFLYAFRLLN